MSQEEYKELKIKQTTDVFLSAIKQSGSLPWRSVYDSSFRPLSARKFVENLKRLEQEGFSPEEAYPLARRLSGYSKANALTLMAVGTLKGMKYAITGTQHFFNKVLPEKYPEFVNSEASYVGVKKGEKLTPLVSFYPLRKDQNNSDPEKGVGDSGNHENGKAPEIPRMGMSTHSEMYLEQTVGVDISRFLGPKLKAVQVDHSLDRGLSLCADFAAHLGVEIRTGMASQTAQFCYAIDANKDISLRYTSIPPVEGFVSAQEWVAATFHELAHAAHSFEEPEVFTGKFVDGSRLSNLNEEQLDAYKEIVAEFTAAIVAIESEVVLSSSVRNSAAYVAGFMAALSSLQEDDRHDVIRRSISIAGKISDSMLTHDPDYGHDIDYFIEQQRASKVSAIIEHNEAVAAFVKKDPDKIDDEDKLAYLKSQVSDEFLNIKQQGVIAHPIGMESGPSR